MSLILKDYQSNIAVGLGTFTYTVPAAGIYAASATSTVLPTSGLSIVIQQNGTQVASSISPSAAGQVIAAQTYSIDCALNDVISIIISSSNANDEMLNTVKTIMTVGLIN